MSNRFRNRRESEELSQPEILPMMNILFMLVLVLMGMSTFLPIGVISIQAPQFGGGGPSTSQPHVDVNLTVMILKNGLNLSVGGSMLKGAEGPLFPKGPTGYNFSALREKLVEIKAQYPTERRIILMADPDVIYDDITHVMDAARPMFDEVAFVPGVVQ